MFVYIIGSPRGPKKIGCTKDIPSRLRQLQTSHHKEIKVLFSIPVPENSCSAIERRVHWLLKEKRLNGEWFKVGINEAIAAVRRAGQEDGIGELAPSGAGRPKLSRNSKTTLTGIRLTDETRDRIVALVGKNQMAAFIRDAIDAELERREKADKK